MIRFPIATCVGVALVALACNHENERTMTPANGSTEPGSSYPSADPNSNGTTMDKGSTVTGDGSKDKKANDMGMVNRGGSSASDSSSTNSTSAGGGSSGSSGLTAP